IYGQTIDPFIDYSANAKLTYQLSDKSKLTLSGRFFTETQFNNYLIYPKSEAEIVKGKTIETDGSLFARFEHKINNKVTYLASVYATAYSNNASVFMQKNDSLYETIRLSDFMLRPELQVNIGKNPASLFVTGIGFNFEN